MKAVRIGDCSKEELEKFRKENEEEFANQIMAIAYSYAIKNPIKGYDIEDYSQDLIIDLLTNISLFDDTRGSFSTFCYIRFRAARLKALRMLDRVDTPSEDVFIDLDLFKDSNSKLTNGEYHCYYNKLGTEAKYYIYGYTISAIARQMKTSFSITQRRILDNINEIREELGLCKLYTLR